MLTCVQVMGGGVVAASEETCEREMGLCVSSVWQWAKDQTPLLVLCVSQGLFFP